MNITISSASGCHTEGSPDRTTAAIPRTAPINAMEKLIDLITILSSLMSGTKPVEPPFRAQSEDRNIQRMRGVCKYYISQTEYTKPGMLRKNLLITFEK
jgi:hypothetical protein